MTRKPRRVKIASMRSRSRLSGWRWPIAGVRPGSVTSTAPLGGRACAAASMRSPRTRSMCSLAALASCPSRGRSSAGAAPSDLQQRRDEPALPRQVFVAEGAEVGLRAGAGEILLELLAERFEGSDRIRHPLRLARTWRAAARRPPRSSRGARRPPGSRRRDRRAACDRSGCPRPSGRRSADGR